MELRERIPTSASSHPDGRPCARRLGPRPLARADHRRLASRAPTSRLSWRPRRGRACSCSPANLVDPSATTDVARSLQSALDAHDRLRDAIRSFCSAEGRRARRAAGPTTTPSAPRCRASLAQLGATLARDLCSSVASLTACATSRRRRDRTTRLRRDARPPGVDGRRGAPRGPRRGAQVRRVSRVRYRRLRASCGSRCSSLARRVADALQRDRRADRSPRRAPSRARPRRPHAAGFSGHAGPRRPRRRRARGARRGADRTGRASALRARCARRVERRHGRAPRADRASTASTPWRWRAGSPSAATRAAWSAARRARLWPSSTGRSCAAPGPTRRSSASGPAASACRRSSAGRARRRRRARGRPARSRSASTPARTGRARRACSSASRPGPPRQTRRPRPRRRSASWPQGSPFPDALDRQGAQRRRRSVRRLASGLIVLDGLANVAVAVSPPLRARLHAVLAVLPLGVAQTAAALVALTGVAMIMLARGRPPRPAPRVGRSPCLGPGVSRSSRTWRAAARRRPGGRRRACSPSS